jgi:heparanase 1
MHTKWVHQVCDSLAKIVLAMAAIGTSPLLGKTVSLDPASMVHIATIDPRYQSYNVEMAEVVGGKFWKPYAKLNNAAGRTEPSNGSNPAHTTFQIGQSPGMFEAWPPLDLANQRLRKLAAALAPAYVRVSGTWANSVFFQDSDAPTPRTAPKGFQSVLSRGEWKGVVDFAHAVNAEIVTSFAISPGVRNTAGVWTPDQARRLLAYTKSIGGDIAAAEFFNEPSYAAMGDAPPGYDAADYARDFSIFHHFARATAPKMRIVGPGSVGEGITLMPGPLLKTADLLSAHPRPVFDIFSYHPYAAASERCAALDHGVVGTTKAAALSEEWLSRPDRINAFYEELRDRFEPNRLVWVTETADAACGGNPWAATFLDSFRYLDQLGRLAKRGVQVVFHNTLASSDYGLIDQETLKPRPNYWAALLWRRLMGSAVLDAGAPEPGLHLYAHCLRHHPGGVVILAINTSRTEAGSLRLPVPAERYTLTGEKPGGDQVQLNGHELATAANNDLPALAGQPTSAGQVALGPMSITFMAIPSAGNTRCR